MAATAPSPTSGVPAVAKGAHCTGRAQYRFMAGQMPRLHYIATGQTIEL